MFVTKLLWIFLIKAAVAAPKDEFRSYYAEGELFLDNDDFHMSIIPGIGYSPQKSQKQEETILNGFKINENINLFNRYVEKGITAKDLSFNIYDDSMREAAIALHRLFQNLETSGHDPDKLFEFKNINEDLITYARDLEMLYRNKRGGKISFVPPFIRKPNYFVNSETIIKALKLCRNMNHNSTDSYESRVNQITRIQDTIIINTNYSGWNLPQNGGEEPLTYFREDIALNSYYYGIHLLHPFWMSNDELDELNPRHAEHYYYSHQQLMARYNLEKEYMKQGNSNISLNTDGDSDFNPYLIHDNGLPFPVRSNTLGDWTEERTKLKSIDIAIRECISRGLIVINNGTAISMTEDSHIDLLSKLIRANFDGVKLAKTIRALFGYGGNGYPIDEYNPAPSLLHYPETSLRDPIYWYMIEYMLRYFIEYKNSMKPYNMSQYETEDINIIDVAIPKITTYFDFYQLNINKALSNNDYVSKWPITITARQKRLQHSQFTLGFTVESRVTKSVVVRLFLGPPCDDDCWEDYASFFEIDSFVFNLQKGTNKIAWSPDTSTRISHDDYYNMEQTTSDTKDNRYSMFKFPANLLIPRGLDVGLNLTLFIMITPTDDIYEKEFDFSSNLYRQVCNEIDSKPLGFPFHRLSIGHSKVPTNYKFHNIPIYHKRYSNQKNGYFSPHLY